MWFSRRIKMWVLMHPCKEPARRQNQSTFVEWMHDSLCTVPGRWRGEHCREMRSSKSSLWEDEIDLIAHRKRGHLAGTRRPLNNDVHTPSALRLKETGIPVAFPGPHLPLWSSRQTRAADGPRRLQHGPRIRCVSTEISSAPHAAICHLLGHLHQPRNLISAGAVPLPG